MKNYKDAQVIMLATKDKTRISLNKNNLLINRDIYTIGQDDEIYQHLHIVNNDTIQENDWFIGDNASLKKCTLNNAGNINFKGGWYSGSSNCKKVIATTDITLKRVVGIGTFAPLPQLSKEWIEYFISEYNKENVTTDVLVEYEEFFELEDYDDDGIHINWFDKTKHKYFKSKIKNRHIYKPTIKINSDNTITIKSTKDTWNREEVAQLLIDCCGEVSCEDGTLLGKDPVDLYNWITQKLINTYLP